MSLLEFKNASYINGNKNILKNISIEITSGDYISIIGPSGSGKSTFLKLCCHLITPSSGEILYKDKPITEYDPIELRKNVAYSPQTPCLFGDTVMDNMSFPFYIRNTKVDLKRIYELFSLFNLNEEYLKKENGRLSGGEKQRLALIRTLLFTPEVLLLDEITSSLDTENIVIVERIIYSLYKQGVTVLWITHDAEQSKRYSNKILTIENGEIKSSERLK